MSIKRTKRTAVALTSFGLLLLAGCSNAQMTQPSAACKAAFDAASDAIEVLYATHPFYSDEYDNLYADGVITDEEQAQLDAWMADEEVQYTAINEPTYDACQGVEDFYAGAFSQGDRADWGLEGTGAISREELKDIFLSSRCYEQEARPACADYQP